MTADCLVKQNAVKLAKAVTVKGKSSEIQLEGFYLFFSIGFTIPGIKSRPVPNLAQRPINPVVYWFMQGRNVFVIMLGATQIFRLMS